MRRRHFRASASRLAVILLLVAPTALCAQTADELFNDEVLHRLDIAVNSRDWDTLRENFKENDYYPCDLTWNGNRIRNVAMRSRGSGSRSGVKPGLEIDFNHYSAPARFLGLKALVLDNLTTDPSMIRERVAMAFFRRFGLLAPREVHAQVYVNGEYAGLYAIVEPIDGVFVDTLLGDDGTLFEYKWITRFNGEYLGEDLELYRPLFEPRTHKNRSVFDLYDPIRELFWAVRWAPDLQGTVGALLDFESTLRLIAAETLVAEWDGILGYSGMNNFYLYRHSDTRQHRLLPWDKDESFRQWDYPIMTGALENTVMRRVLAEPTLRMQYFDLLVEAAQSSSELDWLEGEIRKEYEQIRESALADRLKPYSNEEFEQNIADLLEFAEKRPSFVIEQAQQQRGP